MTDQAPQIDKVTGLPIVDGKVDISNGIPLTTAERDGLHQALDELTRQRVLSDLEQEEVRIAREVIDAMHKVQVLLPILARVIDKIPEVGPIIAPWIVPVGESIEGFFGAQKSE